MKRNKLNNYFKNRKRGQDYQIILIAIGLKNHGKDQDDYELFYRKIKYH